ncbi:MAG TPA: hypothetical protein VF189_01185 [Patescibacteria group bacterium]
MAEIKSFLKGVKLVLGDTAGVTVPYEAHKEKYLGTPEKGINAFLATYLGGFFAQQLAPALSQVITDHQNTSGPTKDNHRALVPAIWLDALFYIPKVASFHISPVSWPIINFAENAIIRSTRAINKKVRRLS